MASFQLHNRPWHWTCAWLCAAAASVLAMGCHSLKPLSETALKPADASKSKTAGATAVEPLPQSPDAQGDDDPLMRGLALGRWWPTPPTARDEGSTSFRWRHDGVERATDQANLPRLRSAMESTETALRTNAAIALARLGDRSACRPLLEAIERTETETNQRCAAIESMASVDVAGAPDPKGIGGGAPAADRSDGIDQNLVRMLRGAGGQASAEHYQPAVHAELLFAAAKRRIQLEPALLENAISSPSAEVRTAALGCYGVQDAAMPQAASDLRSDPEPRVRIAALAAIAARDRANAIMALAEALHDADFQVRLASIRELGTLGSDEARSLLGDQLKDRGELVRAAAVSALCQAGDWPRIASTAEDASFRVRRAVAQALGRFPTAQARGVAERFVHDPSPDVELATVEAVARWPRPWAVPVLLGACDHLAISTRQRARDRLVELWPAAKTFSPTAPAARRAEMLADLRGRVASEIGEAADDPPRESAPRPAAEDQRRESLRKMVIALGSEKSPETVQKQLDELRRFGSELPSLLEPLAGEEKLLLREEIYTEILPDVNPSFAILRDMRSAGDNDRRRASGVLAARSAAEPLGALALARLADQMTREKDPVVWLNVWRALGDRTGEPIDRLVALALEQPTAEVRQHACDYLARRGDRRWAPVLLAALADASPNVARSAARALGGCGPLSDASALEQALESRDPELRFAAAVSLTRLGLEAGPAALERFTYEGDSNLRRETAEAMGVLKDSRFVPALIRLLEDRDSVRRIALLALRSIVGDEPAGPSEKGALTYDERARRWQSWWDAQGRAAEVVPR